MDQVSGISAIQTSVSQAILSTCCLNCRKSGKALTYSLAAPQSFRVTSNSSTASDSRGRET